MTYSLVRFIKYKICSFISEQYSTGFTSFTRSEV